MFYHLFYCWNLVFTAELNSWICLWLSCPVMIPGDWNTFFCIDMVDSNCTSNQTRKFVQSIMACGENEIEILVVVLSGIKQIWSEWGFTSPINTVHYFIFMYDPLPAEIFLQFYRQLNPPPPQQTKTNFSPLNIHLHFELTSFFSLETFKLKKKKLQILSQLWNCGYRQL